VHAADRRDAAELECVWPLERRPHRRVPELTRINGIKLNAHLSLPLCLEALLFRAMDQPQAPNSPSAFEVVCVNCDALGIVFDCPEDAPSSTLITCRHCGAPRGTLGALRNLATSDRQDIFDL
jgi:ribosomal protein S27E